MAKSEYAKSLDRIAKIVYDNSLKAKGFTKKNRIFYLEGGAIEAGLVQIIELVQGPSFCQQHNTFGIEFGLYVPELRDSWLESSSPIERPKVLHAWMGRPRWLSDEDRYSLENCDEVTIADDIIRIIGEKGLPMFAQFQTREQIILNRSRYAKYEDFGIRGMIEDAPLFYMRMGQRAEAISAMNDAARYVLNQPDASIVNYARVLFFSDLWDLPMDNELKEKLLSRDKVDMWCNELKKRRQKSIDRANKAR